MEKRDSRVLLVRMYHGATTIENSMEVAPKIKNKTIIRSPKSTRVIPTYVKYLL